MASKQLSMKSVYSMESDSYFGWTNGEQATADLNKGEGTGFADELGAVGAQLVATATSASTNGEVNTIMFYNTPQSDNNADASGPQTGTDGSSGQPERCAVQQPRFVANSATTSPLSLP